MSDLEEIVEEMLDCISKIDHTFEYTGYFAERIEAARKGRTCKVVSKPCDMWECECGKVWWHGGAPNYCPSCGRRAES